MASLMACHSSGDNVNTNVKQIETMVEGTVYTVDTTSTVTWTASKPTAQHMGNFPLQEGTFIINNDSLVGGNFVLDISRLKDNDLVADPGNQAKLEGHLKSPDFFNVAKFPLANFVITAVAPYVADSTKEVLLQDPTHYITGNLTLRDITKSITFPARVTVDNATAAAQADFNIDRSDWGLNYKGPGNPQDWIISKTVNIKLSLTATKK